MLELLSKLLELFFGSEKFSITPKEKDVFYIRFLTTIPAVHLLSRISYIISSLDMQYGVDVRFFVVVVVANQYHTVDLELQLKEKQNEKSS